MKKGDVDDKEDDMTKDVSTTIRKCTSEALMLGGSLTLASKLPSVDAEFGTILAACSLQMKGGGLQDCTE